MKKRDRIIMILIFWIVVVSALHSLGLITTDVNKINVIICGSMIFGPYEGFLLSVLSLAISQSIMYAVGRFFQKQLLGEEFLEKNKENLIILKKHDYKVLALGIACPVTPSDLITVSAACIKLNYKKCIATIVMADAPMIFLYGFLGTGLQETVIFKVLAIIAITFVSYYTFYIWNKIKMS